MWAKCYESSNESSKFDKLTKKNEKRKRTARSKGANCKGDFNLQIRSGRKTVSTRILYVPGSTSLNIKRTIHSWEQSSFNHRIRIVRISSSRIRNSQFFARCEFRVSFETLTASDRALIFASGLFCAKRASAQRDQEKRGNLVSRECAIVLRCVARRPRDKESAKRIEIRELRSTVRDVATSFVKSVCSPR